MSDHRYAASEEKKPNESVPKKNVWKKYVQLIAVSIISLALIGTGTVGLMVSSVLGRINREEITGNPNATFESTLSLLEDEDWIRQMLSSLEPETSAETTSVLSSEIISSAAVSSAVHSDSAQEATAKAAAEAQKAIDNKIAAAKAGYAKTHELPLLTDPNIQNYLLVGTDASGIGDSTIIVSLNRNTGKIHLTSLMRAMYVNIPGRGWFMFNHAYAWGGPKLTIQTIEDNFRIPIDDYIIVNFNSFPRVIDAVGGVDLMLSAREANYMTQYGYPFSAGPVHMNGDAALVYCRMRYTDSDFNRTNRQRNVIQSTIQKAMQMSPAEIYTLAGELAGMVNTSLSVNEILGLAAQVPGFAGYAIDQKMLPIENDTTGGRAATFAGKIYIPYSAGSSLRVEAYALDYEKNVDAIRKFIAR